MARITEPGAASPSSRLEAISRLAAAGLRPSVLMAPILPGISDGEEQMRRLTRACLDAGADHVTPILLHLRPGVREHYFEWLERELPALVDLHRDAYRAGPYGRATTASGWRRSCATRSAREQVDVRQVPEALAVIEPVSDNERIGGREPDVARLDLDQPPVGAVEQSAHLDRFAPRNRSVVNR